MAADLLANSRTASTREQIENTSPGQAAYMKPVSQSILDGHKAIQASSPHQGVNCRARCLFADASQARA